MAEFDYTAVADPATYTDEDKLHALFAHMRKHDPVAWVEPEGFTPFWSITKHADIMEIEKDKTLFINEPRTVLLNDEGTQFFIDTVGTHNPVRSLVQMDDPDHVKYRALAQAFFMPKSLRKFEGQVDEIAANFVKRLEGKTECDFVTDLAVWYPLHVVMMVLGVPEKDEKRMLKLTQELFGAGDSDMQRDEDPAAIFETIADFHAYFTALSENRRKKPQDDIATIIANAKIDGEPIPDFEALSYYIIVATAGHDTTSSSTAGGLLALLEHPEELAKLKAKPDLMPSAVNEMIRWVTPVKHFMRTATADYELRGKTIKKGQSVMLHYPSANRDEDVFENPNTFKVDREHNPQIAFGYGAHLCLGMHLARMEMAALFRQLLPRLESVALNGETSRVESHFVSGLKTLPIKYEMLADA